jgi:hypothetical protein
MRVIGLRLFSLSASFLRGPLPRDSRRRKSLALAFCRRAPYRALGLRLSSRLFARGYAIGVGFRVKT